jgi:gliding motility-associated-like protein
VTISLLISLTGNGTTSGLNEFNTCFDYTPLDNFIGLDFLTVQVCDNGVPSLCDSALLVINVRPRFIIPQAISPNGDGLNDTWFIDGIENYPNNTVTIFSRWGDVVYKVSGYDNTNILWQGEFLNGKDTENSEVPDGTYFYEIQLNGKSKISGFVVLKR